MQNIPKIAKKLLITSCEYHENSEADQIVIHVDNVVSLYHEKEEILSEKVIQIAFQYLADKKYIKVLKKGITGSSITMFQITALGFDEANRSL